MKSVLHIHLLYCCRCSRQIDTCTAWHTVNNKTYHDNHDNTFLFFLWCVSTKTTTGMCVNSAYYPGTTYTTNTEGKEEKEERKQEGLFSLFMFTASLCCYHCIPVLVFLFFLCACSFVALFHPPNWCTMLWRCVIVSTYLCLAVHNFFLIFYETIQYFDYFFPPFRYLTMTCTKCCGVTPAQLNVSDFFNSRPFANNRILSGSTGKSSCPAFDALLSVYSFVFS